MMLTTVTRHNWIALFLMGAALPMMIRLLIAPRLALKHKRARTEPALIIRPPRIAPRPALKPRRARTESVLIIHPRLIALRPALKPRRARTESALIILRHLNVTQHAKVARFVTTVTALAQNAQLTIPLALAAVLAKSARTVPASISIQPV